MRRVKLDERHTMWTVRCPKTGDCLSASCPDHFRPAKKADPLNAYYARVEGMVRNGTQTGGSPT